MTNAFYFIEGLFSGCVLFLAIQLVKELIKGDKDD